jgi:hypothetical protein
MDNGDLMAIRKLCKSVFFIISANLLYFKELMAFKPQIFTKNADN